MDVLRVLRAWLRHVFIEGDDHANANELAVLSAILSGGDERHDNLIRQFERAPSVERVHPTDDSFRVSPTSTTEDLSFPLEFGRVASDWLLMVDPGSGRTLEFRVTVDRGGFLGALEGHATDGLNWPRDWQFDPAQVDGPPARLTLPSIDDARAELELAHRNLGTWLQIGELPGRSELMTWFPPATAAQIDARERSLGVRLPEAFREFAKTTNGLDIGHLHIYGTDDIYRLDQVGPEGVVTAWDADDVDDYVVVLSPTGIDQTVYRVDVHEETPVPRPIATDFRDYLAAEVGRRLRS